MSRSHGSSVATAGWRVTAFKCTSTSCGSGSRSVRMHRHASSASGSTSACVVSGRHCDCPARLGVGCKSSAKLQCRIDLNHLFACTHTHARAIRPRAYVYSAQICGGVQSASFRSDEIDQMLIDFVFSLRRHRRYQGAAFVVAIEGNMSYIEADRIASIVQKGQVQPVVVLAEDGQKKGRYGVHTGHMEKSAYIEVIQALMVRGGLYWAAAVDFVGRYNRGAEPLSGSILKAQLAEFQSTMHGEMLNYRSERRDPKVGRARTAPPSFVGGRLGPGQGRDLWQGPGPKGRHIHVAADSNLLGAAQDRRGRVHGSLRAQRLVESRRRAPDPRCSARAATRPKAPTKFSVVINASVG